MLPPPSAADWIALCSDPLPVSEALGWATVPSVGAVVCFLGTVRDHAEGRSGVRGMTYEAYQGQAERVLHEIAAEVRHRWSAIERLALLHRTGDLALTETSVAVVASAPHRDDAFEAARFGIDTLKETAPIWKRERWEGGSGWARAAHDVRPVQAAGS